MDFTSPRVSTSIWFAVVVKSRIFEEQSDGASPFSSRSESAARLFHGGLELVGKFFVVRELADTALAGVDVVRQLPDVGDRLVRVVVKLLIFQKLAGRALALLELSSANSPCRLRQWLSYKPRRSSRGDRIEPLPCWI